ncbi:hypothetical protein HPP92_016326 [Vanilla planifolia]|uniref:Uncharacterized protein n=1 Tax=Vanilla planifolia TaxID=51239 RepID=A0A835QJV3_VANPL|nr:hypothetical protein HPP92_016326 [Vanilla planifolia]
MGAQLHDGHQLLFGAGVGLGSAYIESSYIFSGPPKLAPVEVSSRSSARPLVDAFGNALLSLSEGQGLDEASLLIKGEASEAGKRGGDGADEVGELSEAEISEKGEVADGAGIDPVRSELTMTKRLVTRPEEEPSYSMPYQSQRGDKWVHGAKWLALWKEDLMEMRAFWSSVLQFPAREGRWRRGER